MIRKIGDQTLREFTRVSRTNRVRGQNEQIRSGRDCRQLRGDDRKITKVRWKDIEITRDNICQQSSLRNIGAKQPRLGKASAWRDVRGQDRHQGARGIRICYYVRKCVLKQS